MQRYYSDKYTSEIVCDFVSTDHFWVKVVEQNDTTIELFLHGDECFFHATAKHSAPDFSCA